VLVVWQVAIHNAYVPIFFAIDAWQHPGIGRIFKTVKGNVGSPLYIQNRVTLIA
jgi:hypothetical protein